MRRLSRALCVLAAAVLAASAVSGGTLLSRASPFGVRGAAGRGDFRHAAAGVSAASFGSWRSGGGGRRRSAAVRGLWARPEGP